MSDPQSQSLNAPNNREPNVEKTTGRPELPISVVDSGQFTIGMVSLEGVDVATARLNEWLRRLSTGTAATRPTYSNRRPHVRERSAHEPL
jgi:hypothetical protein